MSEIKDFYYWDENFLSVECGRDLDGGKCPMMTILQKYGLNALCHGAVDNYRRIDIVNGKRKTKFDMAQMKMDLVRKCKTCHGDSR